jgi:hypothetical protein
MNNMNMFEIIKLQAALAIKNNDNSIHLETIIMPVEYQLKDR